CLKLCKLGNYNVLLPQVKLFHFESKSRGSDFTSKKFQRYLNETQFMNDKWQALIEKDPFYNPNFTKTNCFLLDRP
ncbi:glycosyltransferase family 2 protein, partial [bacterium]|nr:glycosyltransferase family 2 protein [bacterium]